MVLPGVSRIKRINFVEELICTLIENGLEGITDVEFEKLTSKVTEFLASVVTAAPVDETEKASEKRKGC